MNYDEKKPAFVSLISDTTFRYMFENEKMRKWFIDIIKAMTRVDLSGYHLVDNDTNTGNFLKDYRSNLVLSDNENCVIIEMNSSYCDAEQNKGKHYLLKEVYALGEKFTNKKIVLIMFNDYKEKDLDGCGEIESWFDYNDLGTKCCDIDIFKIFLPIYHKMCYDKCSEIDKKLWLFSSKSYEEMRSSVKNDSNLCIIEELERLGMDDNFVDEYNREITTKKIMNSIRSEGYSDGEENGIKIGIEKGKLEIAKNLLRNNINIDLVLKCTDLTIRELAESFE